MQHRQSNGNGPPGEAPVIAVSSGDIVTDFVTWTSDDWSPEIFRRWAGIAMVAAALERRVWVDTGARTTFPNLYTFLVGAPGQGKSIIEKVKRLIVRTTLPGTKEAAFHVAPDNMTPAALIDDLTAAKKTHYGPKGQNYDYSALFVPAEEFLCPHVLV